MANQGMIEVPKKKDFYINSETEEKLCLAAQLSAVGKNCNILVTGRQGCGKSELASQFAASTNRPFFFIEVGLLSEAGQLWGTNTVRNGEIVFEEYGMLKALQTPFCVIELDELNRAGNSKSLNDLFSVLDDRREVWLDEKKSWVKVAEGVTFFATVNEGIDFVGVDSLDAALRDRFYHIEMKYLPNSFESDLLQKREGITAETADKLCKIFSRLRADGVEISTRKALDIARLVKLDAPIRRAISFSLATSDDMLEKILLTLHLNQEADEKIEEKWVML